MVIGIDGSRAFISPRTGTEEYSYQLLSHLAKIDHRNDYHLFLRPQALKNNQSSKMWPSNFKFITLIPSRFWTQIGLSFRTFTDNLDVLFVPSHTLPLIARPGLKTVVTVHDLGAEFLPKTHQIKQRLYLKFMTHYQIKHASHIIAVSEATKKDIIKKVGVDPQKITVIHEAYDPNLYQPISKEKRHQTIKKYKLEDRNYLLFVGTVQPRKNLERLIRAYYQFLRSAGGGRGGPPMSARSEARTSIGGKVRQDPQLIITGSKGWLSDEIYQLPKKLGIEKFVEFLGYIPKEDLPSLYSGAKALLFPSLFEGFGLPILEAEACGCSVLTSNTSSMPEVAGKSAILVDPYSVESIRRGITRIMNNELRIKLQKKGFQNIKRFSWEKAARETLKVLTNI